MNQPISAPGDRGHVPWQTQGAVYGAGTFSNSSFHLYNLAVPLWVVMLEPSPFMIGVALGSRQLLSMLLSIHGGALMDRLGTRRVMLAGAVLSVIIPLLYPLLPWIWAVIVLQMVGGLAAMLCWIGAQSMIGQVMAGHPSYTGRLSFCTRMGVFAGPPLVGAMWDLFGPWGAFTTLSLWGCGMLTATFLLPRPQAVAAPPAGRIAMRDLLPNVSDYAAAFRLMAIPAIAMVVVATMLRHSGVSMQSSFYVVYLGGIGITGTLIGTLISVSGICGAGGSLLVGPMARAMPSNWLLVLAVGTTVVMIAITPLLGTYVALLIAIGMRGASTGVAQAMEISNMARSAGAEAQGKGAALRVSAGRVSAFIVPIVMGAVVEVAGLENSFYIMGGVIIAALAVAGMRLGRAAGSGE